MKLWITKGRFRNGIKLFDCNFPDFQSVSQIIQFCFFHKRVVDVSARVDTRLITRLVRQRAFLNIQCLHDCRVDRVDRPPKWLLFSFCWCHCQLGDNNTRSYPSSHLSNMRSSSSLTGTNTPTQSWLGAWRIPMNVMPHCGTGNDRCHEAIYHIATLFNRQRSWPWCNTICDLTSWLWSWDFAVGRVLAVVNW